MNRIFIFSFCMILSWWIIYMRLKWKFQDVFTEDQLFFLVIQVTLLLKVSFLLWKGVSCAEVSNRNREMFQPIKLHPVAINKGNTSQTWLFYPLFMSTYLCIFFLFDYFSILTIKVIRLLTISSCSWVPITI